MRDEGTDSAAHFSVCGNPESWSTAPGTDFIEHQLAHAVRDPNGRAYNRTAFLPERRVDAGMGRLSRPMCSLIPLWVIFRPALKVGELVNKSNECSTV